MPEKVETDRDSEQVKPATGEKKATEELTTSTLAGASQSQATSTEERSFAPSSGDAREEAAAPLFPGNETADLRKRWDAIQSDFVDEPRNAVEKADNLVAQAMKRLAEMFSEERGRLEAQWNRGENVETEDLRIALQRYRSFFSRLLSV